MFFRHTVNFFNFRCSTDSAETICLTCCVQKGQNYSVQKRKIKNWWKNQQRIRGPSQKEFRWPVKLEPFSHTQSKIDVIAFFLPIQLTKIKSLKSRRKDYTWCRQGAAGTFRVLLAGVWDGPLLWRVMGSAYQKPVRVSMFPPGAWGGSLYLVCNRINLCSHWSTEHTVTSSLSRVPHPSARARALTHAAWPAARGPCRCLRLPHFKRSSCRKNFENYIAW